MCGKGAAPLLAAAPEASPGGKARRLAPVREQAASRREVSSRALGDGESAIGEHGEHNRWDLLPGPWVAPAVAGERIASVYSQGEDEARRMMHSTTRPITRGTTTQSISLRSWVLFAFSARRCSGPIASSTGGYSA